jgi:hypothetical protein
MPKLKHTAVAALACALLLLGMRTPAGAGPARAPDMPAACPVVVTNGNFEAQGANWTQSGAGFQLITDFNPRTGKYSADLGGAPSSKHSITQRITLPARKPLFLRFWWQQVTEEFAPSDADKLTVLLLNTDGTTRAVLGEFGNGEWPPPPWEPVAYDISAHAGRTVDLRFEAANDSIDPTRFYIDDVSIPACWLYLPLTRK